MKKIALRAKTPAQVIATMCQERHFKPLVSLFFCKDFLATMMSKAQQLLISKILVKNYTLIILTKNSSAYAELNHKNVKEDIKFRLKMYAEKVPQSPFAGVNEVKILSEGYFDKTPLKKENLNLSVNLDGGEDLDADSEFIELSDGEFKNFFEDEKLFEKFEAIRKAILKNNEKNE